MTRSTNGTGREVACRPSRGVSEEPGLPGERGGDDGPLITPVLSCSTKKEYEINLDIQSRLAIINFSFLVSHANRRGSNISRGRSPPCPARTISSARCTLSFKGVERFASRDAAIVSKAVRISTVDTVLPLDMVKERLCAGGDVGFGDERPGVEGREEPCPFDLESTGVPLREEEARRF